MSVNCKSPRKLRIEELADQVRELSAENQQLRCLLSDAEEQEEFRVSEMRVENERLSEQVKKLGAQLSWWQDADPIIKDAERYRWLRDRINMDHMRDILSTTISGNVLDVRIDEALKDG